MKIILILFLLGVTCQLIHGKRQQCQTNQQCKPSFACVKGYCRPGPLNLNSPNKTTQASPNRGNGIGSILKGATLSINNNGVHLNLGGRHRGRSAAAPQACSTGADCGSQSVCVDGQCVVDNGYGGKCSVGAHCPNGYNCVNAKCVKSSKFHEKKKMSCPIRCPDGMACKNGACLPIG